MLRTLVLLLALLNVALFAWTHGWLAAAGLAPHADTEPQRLAQQIAPDSVRILAAGASAAASAPAEATRATAAASAPAEPGAPAASAAAAAGSATAPSAAPSAALPTASAAQTAAAAPTVCREIGPYGAFETDAVDAAVATLRAAGLAPQREQHPLNEQWMVWLPQPSDAAVKAELDRLAQTRLTTYAAVVDRPRYQPGISLGVFSSETAARVQLQNAVRAGISGAQVVPRNAGLTRTVLRLPALTPAQLSTLQRLVPKLGGQTVRTCEKLSGSGLAP